MAIHRSPRLPGAAAALADQRTSTERSGGAAQHGGRFRDLLIFKRGGLVRGEGAKEGQSIGMRLLATAILEER